MAQNEREKDEKINEIDEKNKLYDHQNALIFPNKFKLLLHKRTHNILYMKIFFRAFIK